MEAVIFDVDEVVRVRRSFPLLCLDGWMEYGQEPKEEEEEGHDDDDEGGGVRRSEGVLAMSILNTPQMVNRRIHACLVCPSEPQAHLFIAELILRVVPSERKLNEHSQEPLDGPYSVKCAHPQRIHRPARLSS